MPQITVPVLQSINDGVNLAYNSQLWAAKSVYPAFTFEAPSTGDAEVYPRLDMLSGLREWIGDRVAKQLSLVTFRIVNRLFEETIAVQRTDIEDDKYGFLTPIAQQLGENAARFPDLLVAQLLLAGHTTPCYDGQNFFDTAHPSFTSSGGATTLANYASGSSPVWYLFDTSRVLKPVIFQKRKPFEIIPKFSPTDPNVFWSKEFEWGVDGRCNVGFGIWQLGFMSTQPLTDVNLLAARALMASYRRPDGAPMGIMPDLLVTGSANYPTAKALYENEFIPGATSIADYGGTAPASLVPNIVKGMFKPLENQWLN
jgi:phage major head subunit gpT-like protein